jgi:hypothetical protein
MAMKSRINATAGINSLVAVAVVVVGLVVTADRMTAASSGISDGARGDSAIEGSRVGQPVVTETVLNADDSPDVFTRAASARDAFGFPVGAKRAGKHVHDDIQKIDYDQVDEVDGAGKPLAQTQFDSSGRLVSAVRFDMPPASSARMTLESASKAALRGVSASGLAPTGQSRTDPNPVLGGWDVHWDRTQDGYAVRGDETRVHVWPDGRIQSVARVVHDLAPAPARRLAVDDANRVVSGQFDRWFAGHSSAYAISESKVEWIAPNAAFDAAKLTAAPSAYRLAWVVNVKPSGAAADYLTLVTLYVDAGDGTILGGDVVE